MFKYTKFDYALFGNPVKHSKSPNIHHCFSNQTGILCSYQSVNITLSQFRSVLLSFFDTNGKGANITAPFKQEAYLFANQLTQRAKIAKSVNTLKKIDHRHILGDNTDGIGLLSDLTRLNFIKKNNVVLILGAGGAARGILFPLLSLSCSIFILNRTVSNAEKLVMEFNKYGSINIFNKHVLIDQNIDLVINATSKYDKNNDKIITSSLVKSTTCFYDMNYQKSNIDFANLSVKLGSNMFANGIGMLVWQAAHSFFLWHNVFPKTDYIINSLQNNTYN